uniref:Uncharacterized protein n=1 Tax=Arundo donax TaxID=35708 RepID=A0A0A9FGU6_ARUDO
MHNGSAKLSSTHNKDTTAIPVKPVDQLRRFKRIFLKHQGQYIYTFFYPNTTLHRHSRWFVDHDDGLILVDLEAT